MSSRYYTSLMIAAWFVVPTHGRVHAFADEVKIIRPPDVKPAADEKKPDLPAAVKIIVDNTNAFRAKEGKSRVEPNAKLTAAAKYFADYMAGSDRYGHTADGKQPADRAEKHGYEYCIVLENIAYRYRASGFTTDDMGTGFFTGWRESPGHRKNMLDPEITETGVAIARSEKTGHYYAVQMFGRPKSKAIEFKITNQARVAVTYQIGEESYTLEPRSIRTHTRCRPADLILEPADKKADSKSKPEVVRPVNGDRLLVTQDKSGYRLRKE